MSELLSCVTSATCPYFFSCIESKCIHDPIIPLNLWTLIVYLLLPFGVMFTNIAGVSPGIYKVPIFMDILDYTVSEATTLTYPMVTGAGLGNLIQLIPKRNPYKATSLVDYNIVLILIPSVIYGTTFGVIIVQLFPPIAQDGLLIVIFTLFVYYFIDKYRQTPQGSTNTLQSEKKRNVLEMSVRSSYKKDLLQSRQDESKQEKRNELIVNQTQKNEDQLMKNNQLLMQVLAYQRTHHVKDIVISTVVFCVFEVLSLFAQGKFIHFNHCDSVYWISISVFTLLYIAYIWFVKRYSAKKMVFYKEIGYQYDIKLGDNKVFFTIFLGAFIGGTLQGLIGLGSGNCMVAALLFIGLNQKVASATSGFQIFFVGLSSLIQAIAEGHITTLEVLWIFSLSFFFGGILSYSMYNYIGPKPNRLIFLILGILSLLSVLGTIVSIVITNHYYHWDALSKLDLIKCN